MANPEHLAVLEKGVAEWNRWRAENFAIELDLSEADLHGADLVGADLRRINLFAAELPNANLNKANLAKADLSRANFRRANLNKANLTMAKLIGANLTSTKLVGADLRGTTFHEANLTMANLSGANLHTANLNRANLRSADLSRANLSHTGLAGADFSRANLGGADLNLADLGHTIFWGAVLHEANFKEARIYGTIFGNVDLSHVNGLLEVAHAGPSSIDIDTIYMSRGKIPDVFLRGTGVPENFITYVGSLVGRPIEFYSCFISYATEDQAFAERLHADLQAKGVRCWFAARDIAGGKKLHDQIDEAILLHDRLLLILSPASMASKWVRTEIAKARKRERDGRNVLFPISLVEYQALTGWEYFDADLGTDSAKEIREYFIPDFSNWKDHDQYQKALDCLLRDLKAEAERAAVHS